MRMAKLPLAFLNWRELGLRRGAQHGVAGGRELVGVHPAEQCSSRVANDAPMHLRPELLRAEQHQTEVAATLCDIEQHLPDVGVGTITRRVLVELIDEDYEMFDAEVPALEV